MGKVWLVSGLAAMAGIAAAQAPSAELATTRVADLLAAADAAAAEGPRGRARLPSLLDALDRLGAHAAVGRDAVAEWRGVARLRARSGPIWRGRVLGPAYHRGALAPATSFRTEQLVLAGERAQVSVATSPRAPVRMTVAGGGVEPCARPATECVWWPSFTGRYTITVENQGNAPVRYYVVID